MLERFACSVSDCSDILICAVEGSHSGLVRAPAKRLGGEIPLMGSNPIPSAILVGVLNLIMLVRSE